MNPKRAPAMATVPDKMINVPEVLKSIKQLEQLKAYIHDTESKLKQVTKSSI